METATFAKYNFNPYASKKLMHSPEETDLLRQLKAGEELALQKLFDLHFQSVVTAAYSVCQDRPQAQDLAQDVFIKFWERRNEIQINTAIRPYLKRMVINAAVAQLRKVSRRKEILALAPPIAMRHQDVEDLVLKKDLHEQASRAIDALPPKCRSVFKLSRYQNLSYKEISEALGITVKTVENHMGNALSKLRTSLKEYL